MHEAYLGSELHTVSCYAPEELPLQGNYYNFQIIKLDAASPSNLLLS